MLDENVKQIFDKTYIPQEVIQQISNENVRQKTFFNKDCMAVSNEKDKNNFKGKNEEQN